MQTEAPTLPVVQSNAYDTINRKSKFNSESLTLESKKLFSNKNTLFSLNKKCLNPLLGRPYRNSNKQHSMSDESKSTGKNSLGQRIMSAKMLRFKQLQNQLADAHYHLNELANENRLLKALQKRQDSALRRYEGTNAELPRIINSHHEELRVLQTKYKKLKDLHKDTCNLLKEKENELHSVNSQNKHLLQLSRDRNLGEREKLQLQISDLNHTIQQQQETIQLLHRKLTLETKSLKHQLHVEITKHKETQKNLQKTIEKLKGLECLLDNREKRLYYNGQLLIYNQEKNLGSRSFTNLSEISTSNSVKISNKNKKSENGMPKNNLPSLDILESNDDEKTETNNVNRDHSVDQLKSETMASLQQIRKFRLPRSPHMRKHAHSMSDLRLRFKDPEAETYDDEKITLYTNASTDFKEIQKRNSLSNNNETGKLRKLFSKLKSQTSQKLQKEMEAESDYSSDGDNENQNEHHIEYYSVDTAQKSRELHARLINGTGDTFDALNNMIKRIDSRYSDEEGNAEEQLDERLVNNLTYQKHKYKNKSQVQHNRHKDFYDSDSEVDSEESKDAHTNGNYSLTEYKTNLSKYDKEQFMKPLNNVTSSEHNAAEIKDSFIEELKDTEQKISGYADVEVPQKSPNAKERWLEEQHLLENNGIDNSFIDIKKENDVKRDDTKYSEDKLECTDISHDNTYRDILKQNVCEEIRSLPSVESKEPQNSIHQAYGEHEIVSRTEQQEYRATENPKTILNKNKFMLNYPDEDNHLMHNLVKEYGRLKVEETPSMTDCNDEEKLQKNDVNLDMKNRLNVSSEAENVNLSNNTHESHQIEQSNSAKAEMMDTQTIEKKKTISYNKEKLLATMKAIDNNENIEFLNQKFKNHNMVNRMQITQNLYRGLPAHSKPKRDVIKDIFEDTHIENKTRGTCSKSH